MSYDLNSKKIKNREKLIKYRKAFKEKSQWRKRYLKGKVN